MYEKLVSLLETSGLWKGDRRQTHTFQLSPEPYVVTKAQTSQLNVIAIALWGVLKGLSRIFAIASDPVLGSQLWWRDLNTKMRSQVPTYFASVMNISPASIPFLNKIDLVEDQDGKLWVVEIDSGNPRGLGYSVLLQCLLRETGITTSLFPGIANVTVEAVRKGGHGRLACLFSNHERWYRPWFETLARALGEKIEVGLVQEDEYSLTNTDKLLLYMPLTMDNAGVRSGLLDKYKSGEISFLMPPKAFLGSKALMAIICNTDQDPILEGILRSQISGEDLATLRAHIPETMFPGSKSVNHTPMVMKSLVASGMKGVFFDLNPSTSMFGTAPKVPTSVFQQIIEGKQHTFNHFDADGRLVQDRRYVRLTAHCGPRSVHDVLITAREDRIVHGAKDAIMTGCVIE